MASPKEFITTNNIQNTLFVLFVTIMLLLGLMLLYPIRLLPYHLDAASRIVNPTQSLIDRQYQPLAVPELGTQQPPLFFVYLAQLWNLFGSTQTVTHLSMLPIYVLLTTSTFLLSKKYSNTTTAIVTSFAIGLTPVIVTSFQLVSLPLAATSFTLSTLYFVKQKQWLAASVMCVIGSLIHVSGLIALIFLLLNTSTRYKQDKKPFQLSLGALVAVIGWFLYHYSVAGWLFISPDVPIQFPPFSIGISYAIYALKLSLISQNLWVASLFLIPSLIWLRIKKVITFEQDPLYQLIILFLGGVGLYYGTMGGFNFLQISLIVPLLLIATSHVLYHLTQTDVLEQQIQWITPVFMAIILFVGLTQWNINNATAQGFYVTPDASLAYQDVIYVSRQAAAYLEANYPDATIYGGYPEVYQLTQPIHGYVTEKLNFAGCSQYQPQSTNQQIIFTHLYHASQEYCQDLLESVDELPLETFQHDGKWIRLYSITSASESATPEE